MSPTPTPAPPPTGGHVEHLYAALADIGDLVAAMPRPPALYAGIVQILEHHVGALLVLAGEIDYTAGVLWRHAPDPVPPGLEDIYPVSVPIAIAGPSFWAGQIEVEPNIVDAPGREAWRPAYARHGIRASAAVPVSCFGKVYAALILRSRDPAFFSAPLLQLLERAALSIGHALEGDMQRNQLDASLLAAERSQRALRLLSETLKAATHADTEDALFAEACQVVVDSGGYPVCWMGLHEATPTPALALRAHAGRGAAFYRDFRLQLDDPGVSTSVSSAVMHTGKPVVKLPREGGAESWAADARDLELGALLGLPLRLLGELAGVLVIGADAADAFTLAEIGVFEEMAKELSLGLERLRARRAQALAEQELRLNLRRFQAILASRYAGILVLDASGRVRFCNATFCRLFDLPEVPEQLVGMSAAALLERIRPAYANPERELERVRDLLRGGVPVEGEELLLSRGRTCLRSFAPITLDGQPYGRVWHHVDITENKAQAAEVERLAYYDAVTGLPNRRLFLESLERCQGQARRQHTLLALGVLNLDGFKHINDQLGHAAADEVLREVARRITAALRDGDVVARLGGDEFALLLAELDGDQERQQLSTSLLTAMREPLPWSGGQLRLSASIGWTVYPADDAVAETLMRHADYAMYAAKELGRDRGLLYSAALEQVDAEQRSMRARIISALDDGSLVLLFQPIVAIDADHGGRVVGAEALLRLRDGALGLLSPALFQHALDDAMLARPIGRFVLDAALRICSGWLAAGLRLPVSVNISTRHLMHPDFVQDLQQALAAHPAVDASLLGIEITETGPLLDPARARLVIEQCRACGVQVSLDDFGTGSASLSHIQKMDVGTLKIDQSFVRDILVESRNIAIAAGIMTTARLLGITVIAEGVENEAQGKLLLSLGCHQLQGYLIAEPMPADTIPAWASTWEPPASWT